MEKPWNRLVKLVPVVSLRESGVGVWLGLLGEVQARIDDRLVEVGHARQRCVLVVLLAEANRVVSSGRLVDRVWGDQAPVRARQTLSNYVSRLRQALSPLAGVGLERRAGGYVLTVDPMTVDVHRFRHLIAQARVTDDQDRAVALFEEALGLWRAEPCAGLDTVWVNDLRDGLERERFTAESDYTDLQLRRGQHGRLVGELTARAQTYPLDERVAGQLMLALYQCGRQADALDHFQQLRARLAEELGIDPGPTLHRLYEQILTTDPALTTPTGESALVAPRPPVPRQLPAQTPHFVGRATELDQLSTLLDTTTGGGTVVITAIGGTAGIGKTALALHWAYQAAQHFPDGQLYVNLRGFDPTNMAVPPGEALRGFLDALAVSPHQIPVSMDAQAALYRSLLADRRMLVVLDNARDTEQVRPLLPGGSPSLVLITSRDQLAGLIAQHAARPLTLDMLTPEEARALLARHLGSDRINIDPHTVTDLINRCAGLPLALAVVAARAATHPGFELRVLAKELADEHTRLDALDTGDPATSARAVFSWSYQRLSTAAARMFRLLGLYPGPDIAPPAATHLANLTADRARSTLDELARAHLLTQPTPGRYAFHDLLRVYATQLATTHDSEDEQRDALTRLFDHYLHTATAAMNSLHPADQQRRPHIRPPATLTAPVLDPTTAQAWLDTERANLTAIIGHTADHGWHNRTIQLASTVLHHLEVGGHHQTTLTIHTHVREVAQYTDDQVTEARYLTSLGFFAWQQGLHQQAAEYRQQALTIFRRIGDQAGQILTLSDLGLVHWQQGRYQHAAHYHQQALTIAHEIHDHIGEAYALHNLGLVFRHQGYYQRAADYHKQALTLAREISFSAIEVMALTNLGVVFCYQGHYQRAADYHQQALTLAREISFPLGEALALTNLGVVFCYQGHYQRAADYHQQALTLAREISFRTPEALALTRLGVVFCYQGHYQRAADYHQQALTLAREISFRTAEAQALTNLGVVHSHQGRYLQALDDHNQALELCHQIDERMTEIQILNNLGETSYMGGQLDLARAQHYAALALISELGDRYGQARAHDGLAHTYHAEGQSDQARHHWLEALTLYTELAVPDIENVRAHLATLPGP